MGESFSGGPLPRLECFEAAGQVVDGSFERWVLVSLVELLTPNGVRKDMEPTAMRSQATSGALHLVFLFLAFSAPPLVGVLDAPAPSPDWRVVEVERVSPFRPTGRFDLAPGRPGPGRGPAPPMGPRPLAKVGPTEDADEPSLAGVTPTEFEDLTGAVAGVADETLGPDAEMALGRLDGGGGRPFGALGMGRPGKAYSCGPIWKKEVVDGVEIARKVGGCEAARMEAMRGIGRAGRAGSEAARDAAADLGEKDEVAIEVTIGRAVVSCGGESMRPCAWKELIGRVVRRHRRELEFCWEQSLQEQGRKVDVELSVTFVIGPQGGEAAVSAAESSAAGLGECVGARASRWIFPGTGEPIRAEYPLRFWAR